LSIETDGQEQTDQLWEALTRDGEPGRCGWCTDPFGVTWQVSPKQMRIWLEHPDAEVRAYADTALRGMSKIVIDELHE
jgi:predicted 3-demethylubiquinone-9 3-methyltransferase (glyoxalase superfamily)